MTPKEKAEELIYEFIEKDLVKTGSGIAEGRDLKDKSFNLAQMPNRSTND